MLGLPTLFFQQWGQKGGLLVESRAGLAVTRATSHHEVAMPISGRQAGTEVSTQACRRAGCPLRPAKTPFPACRGAELTQEGGQGQEQASVVAPAPRVLDCPCMLPALIVRPPLL